MGSNNFINENDDRKEDIFTRASAYENNNYQINFQDGIRSNYHNGRRSNHDEIMKSNYEYGKRSNHDNG